MISRPLARRGLIAGAAALASLPAAGRAQQCRPALAPPALVRPARLVMAINPTRSPLQYLNDRGELQGMRVELGNTLAEKLCLTPDYVRIEAAAMLPGLAAGRWDMVNTGLLWSEDRAREAFLVPYEQVALALMAPRGNPQNIRTPDDVAGKRLAVESGGIEERRARELAAQIQGRGLPPVELRGFDTLAAALQALRTGQVDLAMALDATAMFQQQRGDFTRVIAGLFGHPACFAVRARALAVALVAALNDLKRDGYYDSLLDRYGVMRLGEAAFAIRGPGPAN